MSWVEVPGGSDFGLGNLPYGVFSDETGVRRVGVAIGEEVLDLAAVAEAGLLSGSVLGGSGSAGGGVFAAPSLNGFLALGRPAWTEARETVGRLLSASEGVLRDDARLRARALRKQSAVTLHLPAAVAEFTDFYASYDHAYRCGCLIRDPKNALAPNWGSLPVAYHSRASSVVVSGTPVRRPWGQVPDPTKQKPPELRPSGLLDFELEVGMFVGTGSELGTPVPVSRARDHLFGMVLLNDWSARDVQAWEMAPLGPFTAKNFASSISPWVVTFDALEPFRCAAQPKHLGPVLPYLDDAASQDKAAFDVSLTASIIPGAGSGARETVVTRTNLKNLYWTPDQMVAHHTITGCGLRTGDLLGTGTISGPEPESAGCMLELAKRGSEPLDLDMEVPGTAAPVKRFALNDGDSVRFTGTAGPGVGFGECFGTVLPALESVLA
mmetsp:Transcript_30780/g.100188  ORF Transcript_30780/g.100188 Transcript_30780/m.100188 type:complete len:438 (-) Transcript_30780:831-2144(-)